MSTASILPILTDPSAAGGVTDRAEEPGAATPGDIIIRSCTTLDQSLRIELQGEIDHHSSLPLRALLASAAASGYVRLSLDTRHVVFADSALLNVLDNWSRCHRRLRLGPRSPAVQRLLDAARPVGGAAPRSRAAGAHGPGLGRHRGPRR
ncbi:STAS domain-containing protein [Streptomyces sp. NPDC048566]|uniref:STAS domain-containing protein n=1 Tax=Streptomyces sp. NPDC048566 TaxID=3365569 RepID=UPI00372346AC